MDIAELGLSIDSRPVVSASKDLKKLGESSEVAERKTSGAMEAIDSSMRSLLVPLASVVSGFSAIDKIISTQRSFDVLNAGLITATGNAANASREFERLQKFAAQTPYSLEQSVAAFTQLKNLGLDPSEASMRSYGNTAAAMGRDLSQMIEAVADASVGEFERLKEFGIRASQEGDQVSFTFQGVTTTVRNSAEEIQQYLSRLGETNFAGAMAARMDTLDGAISNLSDSWDNLFLKISQSGIGDGLAGGINTLSDFISEAENVESILDTLAVAGGAAALVIGGRLAGAIQKKTSAMIKDVAESHRAIMADAEQLKTAESNLLLQKREEEADLVKIRNEARKAHQITVTSRAEATAHLDSIKYVQQRLVLDRQEEVRRLQAQISDKGRQQSLSRLAEIRHAEIILENQAAASSKALTVATAAEASATRTLKAAKVDLAKASTATDAAMLSSAAASRAATASYGALTVAARAASGAMALVGGPVGAVVLAAEAFAMLGPELETNQKRIKKISEAAEGGAKSLNDMAAATGNLSQAQQKADMREAVKLLEDQKQAAEMARAELDRLRSDARQFKGASVLGGDVGAAVKAKSRMEEIEKTAAQLEKNIELAERNVLRVEFAGQQLVRDRAAQYDKLLSINNEYYKSVNQIMGLDTDLATKQRMIAAEVEKRTGAIDRLNKAKSEEAAATKYQISEYQKLIAEHNEMQRIENEYLTRMREIESAELSAIQRKELLYQADQKRIQALQDLKAQELAVLEARMQGGQDTGAVNMDYINRSGEESNAKSSDVFEASARRLADTIKSGLTGPESIANRLAALQTMATRYQGAGEGYDVTGMRRAIDNLASMAADQFRQGTDKPMTAEEYAAVLKGAQEEGDRLKAKQEGAYDKITEIDAKLGQMAMATAAKKNLGEITINLNDGNGTRKVTLEGEAAGTAALLSSLRRVAAATGR